MKIREILACSILSLSVAASAAVPWTHQNFLNDPDEFQFAIIPDRTGGDCRGAWTNTLAKMNLLRPEFVMTIGDLIPGCWHSYESIRRQRQELKEMLAKVEPPFYSVVGNHDVLAPPRGKVEVVNGVKTHAYEDSMNLWKEFNGPDYYSFIYKRVLFVCLNSMDSTEASVGFSEKQCDWFRKTLADNADVRWTCIFMHAPQAWNRPEWVRLEDETLAGRKYTVFAGDWHTYLHVRRMGHDYYVLSVAGGASDIHSSEYDLRSHLEGPEYGEMDHVMWVTMTKKGPCVANIMIDGVLPGDYLNELTTKSYMQTTPLSRPVSPEVQARIARNTEIRNERRKHVDAWVAPHFGYRLDDSTECLERAMASDRKRLVIDEQRGPWVVSRPIKVPSNKTVIIDANVEFIRKPGVFPEGKPIFDTTGATNAVIRLGKNVVERF